MHAEGQTGIDKVLFSPQRVFSPFIRAFFPQMGRFSILSLECLPPL